MLIFIRKKSAESRFIPFRASLIILLILFLSTAFGATFFETETVSLAVSLDDFKSRSNSEQEKRLLFSEGDLLDSKLGSFFGTSSL